MVATAQESYGNQQKLQPETIIQTQKYNEAMKEK